MASHQFLGVGALEPVVEDAGGGARLFGGPVGQEVVVGGAFPALL